MALQDSLAGKLGAQAQGFTPEQRFFLGWGQIWCETYTPEFQAFHCKAGAPMVPANRCRVW